MAIPDDNGLDSGVSEFTVSPTRKRSPKLIILITAISLVLAGAGTGAYFVLTHKKPSVEAESAESAPQEDAPLDASKGNYSYELPESSEKPTEKSVDPTKKTVYYDLDDLLVNLQTNDKRPNYLKIKLSLELVRPSDQQLVETFKPRILDSVQPYLRELRVEDLRGSAGIQRLREELLLRLNDIAHPVQIKDVLFLEMLIQ